MHPPKRLTDLQREIWFELLEEYGDRLTPSDKRLFAILVQAEADMREARKLVDSLGSLLKSPNGWPVHNPALAVMKSAADMSLKIQVQLCLTPFTRARVKGKGGRKASGPESGANPWANLRSFKD